MLDSEHVQNTDVLSKLLSGHVRVETRRGDSEIAPAGSIADSVTQDVSYPTAHLELGLDERRAAGCLRVPRPLCPAGVGQPLLVHHENRRVGLAEDFGQARMGVLHLPVIFRSVSSAAPAHQLVASLVGTATCELASLYPNDDRGGVCFASPRQCFSMTEPRKKRVPHLSIRTCLTPQMSAAHCGARSPNGFLCYATSRLLSFLMSVCTDRDDGG
jgi:hypothetical protein